MAKAKLKSYLQSMSGRIDDTVYSTIGKKTYARKYVIPHNPKSESQQFNRSLFTKAMSMWKNLSADEKQQYRKKARKLTMHGHNLFISRYIKLHKHEKTAGIKTVQSAEPITQNGTNADIIRLNSHFAAAPYHLRLYGISAYMQSICSPYSIPV